MPAASRVRGDAHRYQRFRLRANYSRTNHPDQLPTSICPGLSTSGEWFCSGTSTVLRWSQRTGPDGNYGGRDFALSRGNAKEADLTWQGSKVRRHDGIQLQKEQ